MLPIYPVASPTSSGGSGVDRAATLRVMSDLSEGPLVWTAWPRRVRPRAAIGLFLATAALAALAGVIGGDLLWGLLAALLVLVWLNGFLMPTRFEASAVGVVAAGPLFTRRLAWRDATRLAIQSTGGWLGRASGPRWRRRGIDLFWPEGRGVPERLMALAREASPTIEVRDLRPEAPGSIASARTRDEEGRRAVAAGSNSAGEGHSR